MSAGDGFGDVDLIGRPFASLPESIPGLTVWRDDMGKKAKANGVYTLNGHRYIMQKDQILPDGAEIEEAPDVADEPEPEEETRAKEKAPENRARKAAPENRDA